MIRRFLPRRSLLPTNLDSRKMSSSLSVLRDSHSSLQAGDIVSVPQECGGQPLTIIREIGDGAHSRVLLSQDPS